MSDANAVEPRKSFLTQLRERSAIVFTIGLALSIASFVENLHMGKDAIAFVVAELSKIDGWANAVQAVAAIFHGALEWWRGVLRDLLSFLPFEIPQWMHDPISVMLFFVARFRQGFNNPALTVSRLSTLGVRFSDVLIFRLMAAVSLTAAVSVPMILILVIDKSLYSTFSFIELILYCAFVFGLVAVWALFTVLFPRHAFVARTLNIAK